MTRTAPRMTLPSRLSPPSRRRNPALGGTIFCALSALAYSTANACMRKLSMLDADPMWVVFNKELVTVVVVGPYLAWTVARGRLVWPSARGLALLAAVGLAVQVVANLALQWSFGVVGLAVAIPAVFALMITSSAVMGRTILGERVSRRTLLAITLLLAALGLLGLATYAARRLATLDAPDMPTTLHSPLWLLLGVAAPCLAGIIYAMLTTTVRRAVTRAVPVSLVVFVTTFMAIVSLGPLCVARLGIDGLCSTSSEQLLWMYASGTFNLIGFLAITKGLQLTTVVHANVLNASQVALASLAGILWFREPVTAWLAGGVCLTIAGIALVDRPLTDAELVDQHA